MFLSWRWVLFLTVWILSLSYIFPQRFVSLFRNENFRKDCYLFNLEKLDRADVMVCPHILWTVAYEQKQPKPYSIFKKLLFQISKLFTANCLYWHTKVNLLTLVRP